LGKGQPYQRGLLRDASVFLCLADQFVVESNGSAHESLRSINYSIVSVMISAPLIDALEASG
jgi:hypothetical protein